MKKSRVTFDQAIVTGAKPAKPTNPSDGSFNNPTFSVTSQLSPILMCRLCVVPAGRDDRLNPPFYQHLSRLVAVITAVRNQSVWPLPRATWVMTFLDRDGIERLLKERDLRRGRRVQVCSQRSTRAIDQNHPLCALAPFGWAHSTPPFLAGAKLPSQKHSSHLILSRSESSAKKALQRLRRVSSSSHSRSRLQHVEGDPYRGGTSLHGAPVQRIHKIPSKQRRSLRNGRPPLELRRRLGRWGRTFSHCASVKCLHAMEEKYHNSLIHKSLF